MQRTLRILSGGWLGSSATSIFTRGHYPAITIVGKLCIGAVTVTAPGATLAMVLPGAMLAMTLPSATITIEDCD